MRKYVIDASVVVNALVEADKELKVRCYSFLRQALDKKIVLIAPSTLKQEVANALLSRYKKYDLIEPIIESFFQLNIRYIEIDNILLLKALKIAADVNDTVYDATYHALALSRSATFLTCDYKYYERAKEWGGVKIVK